MLERHEDIKISGQRHPFRTDWKVGFAADGKLTALDADFYANAGYSRASSSLSLLSSLSPVRADTEPRVRSRHLGRRRRPRHRPRHQLVLHPQRRRARQALQDQHGLQHGVPCASRPPLSLRLRARARADEQLVDRASAGRRACSSPRRTSRPSRRTSTSTLTTCAPLTCSRRATRRTTSRRSVPTSPPPRALAPVLSPCALLD